MSVGLVIVSHSEKLADGVVELAAQMAPDVTFAAAGGTEADAGGTVGIGTSLEKVMAAFEAAETGSGVVVLTDLGSAVMTAESALELAGGPQTVLLASAPLVEGAVAAAVAAQSGADLAAVREAAEQALAPRAMPVPDADGAPSETAAVGPPDAGPVPPGDSAADRPVVVNPDAEGEFVLVNPMGLHARPAAVLARGLSAMDVQVDVNGVDGRSVMLLMMLAAGEGETLSVKAAGPHAQKAVDFVRQQLETGFGELSAPS
jgi:PTS hybrid protein